MSGCMPAMLSARLGCARCPPPGRRGAPGGACEPKPKPAVSTTPGTETPKSEPPPKAETAAEADGEGGVFEEAPAEGPSEMDVD